MPLLETFRTAIARFSRREQLTQERPPTANLVQPLPANALGLSFDPNLVTNVLNSAHVFPREAPTNPPVSSFFTNAHGFAIHHLTAISQTINPGGTVVQLLAEKGMPGAIHDSSARPSPACCHPNTRKIVRGRIVKWGTNRGCRNRMLWVLGPAGVGKSAVAQTVAEEFQEAGRLGATFFFSRPNHLDDPDAVIPTLACQLATKNSRYKRIIAERLGEDPLILNKNRRTQFKELIIEPFQILLTRHEDTVQEPLLIILYGLDECKGREAQCEFIELISTHVRLVDRFPLIWMICSRPEWHFKSMLSDADFHVVCKREELLIDDAEAQRDVQRLLQASFAEIRRKYSDQLDDNWPPEMYSRYIAVAASGHLGFASFLLRFIGDEHYGDPDGQLEVCINFLHGSASLGDVNPLHALDLLYRRLLSDIPADILPVTKRILGMHAVYDYRSLTVQNQAKFLDLSQASFYRSLRQLHSVLYIPPASEADSASIHVYHASFFDFLLNRGRSRNFSLDWKAIHYDVAIRSLLWQSRTIQNGHSLPLSPWPPTSPAKFSFEVGWNACRLVSDEAIPSIVSKLESFDFSGLRELPRNFGGFLRWLYVMGDSLNKSLISLIEYQASVSMSWGHVAGSENRSLRNTTSTPHAYLSAYIPDADPPSDRFGLKFRLGKVNPICIFLTIQSVVTPFIPPLETPPPSPDVKARELTPQPGVAYISATNS